MQQPVQVTIFNGAYDNQGSQHNVNIVDFLKEFNTSHIATDPNSKEAGTAWSPCHFSGSRSHANAHDAFALVYDFDRGADKAEGLEPETFARLQEILKDWGVAYVLHTTFSDGFYAPRRKCRVILPLAELVAPDEWIRLWKEHEGKFPSAPDQTKIHPGNLFFSPRVPAEHRELFVCVMDLDKPFLEPIHNLFTGVDLNSVQLGRKDWLHELRNTLEKDNTLRKAANALGADLAWSDIELGVAQDTVWEMCEAALKANPSPVKDWAHARRTCDGGVAHVYSKIELEKADKLKQLENTSAAIVVDDRLRDKSARELEKWSKKVSKDDSQLGLAARVLGSYAHILGDDVVTKTLLTAWKSCKNSTLPLSSVETTIAAGIGQGKLSPRGARHDWQTDLKTDNDGFFLASDENIIHVLKNHPDMVDVLGFDVREDDSVVLRTAPWGQEPGIFHEHHAADVAAWLLTVLGCKAVGTKKALEAVLLVCATNPFDSFKDYLENLKWDQTPRLNTWLIDYAGTPDDEYTRAVGAAWLIAAVARTYQPGCKVDNMLVLVSEQGQKKSSLFRALVPQEKLFTDTPPALDDKDVHLCLSSVVVSEWAEMAGFTRKDVETIKHFITGGNGKVRASYARKARAYPRRGVMAGSTNRSEFLRDVTGNRRFWPVESSTCRPAEIAQNRDLLWAEAVCRYKSGEGWWLSSDLEDVAKDRQEAAREKDTLEARFLDYVENGIPESRRKPIELRDADMSGDPNGRVLLWYYDDQMEGDNPQYWTVEQVMHLLELPAHDKRQEFRTREAMTACGFATLPQRKYRNKNIRPWGRKS